jgi:hypothetical protein
MYWSNLQDIRNHLENTIIRLLDGSPVMINLIERNGTTFTLHYSHLLGTGGGGLPLSEFNLESCPLGYTPKGRYLRRSPSRRWRWGLDSRGVRLYHNGSFEARNCNLPSTTLALCIKGEHPSLQELLENNTFGAFDRHWCLTQDMLVYFQAMKVGKVVDNQVVLDKQYKFLLKVLPND